MGSGRGKCSLTWMPHMYFHMYPIKNAGVEDFRLLSMVLISTDIHGIL